MPSLVESLRSALNSEMGTTLAGDMDSAFSVGGSTVALPDTPPVPAAVLVALVDRPNPGLLLTTRTSTLRSHAGQIAFPGGRIDPTDAGPVEAALREAEEEIGLSPAAVSVLGLTSPWCTGTGYAVQPVVGLVAPDLPFRLNPQEVDDLFEVPLAYVLDPANQRLEQAEWKGAMRRFHTIEWEGRRIWGATAGMLVNLGRLLA